MVFENVLGLQELLCLQLKISIYVEMYLQIWYKNV